MSKGGGSRPKYPDWRQMVGRDAEYNRLTEISPLGTSRYEQDPETNQWSRIMEYSPEIQRALSSQLGALNDAYKNIGRNRVTSDSVMRGVRGRSKNTELADMLMSARDRWGV